MLRATTTAAIVLVLACTGCASVTNGSTHPLRIDTLSAGGKQFDGADCKLTNDRGTMTVKSGTSAPVQRSSKDLEIVCSHPGLADARARLISRANAGLAGNIILGGAIGAAIDHGTGAAYTYPSWVRLVFGQFSVFDRQREREGVAMDFLQPPSEEGSARPASGAALARPAGAHAQGWPAIARGDRLDYRVTDRASRATQTVVLRAERVDGGQVVFNGGERVEAVGGEIVRMQSALMGELDHVTPRAGWLPGGKLPQGNWKVQHTSMLSGARMEYDLEAYVEGEQMLRIAGADMRTIRITLRGWANNRVGLMPAMARYEGTVWVSPELSRAVRFEARARAAANFAGSAFEIDETAELLRLARN